MSPSSSASARPMSLNAPWWLALIQGICAIILGFFLLITPGQSMLILVQFLGIYWLVTGMMDIMMLFIDRTAWGWKLLSGILGIICGVVIVQHPIWSTILVPTTLVVIIGVFGIVIGIVDIIRAFSGAGWGAGILGALSILLGIVIIANPIVGAAALPWLLGALGVVGGIALVVMAFQARK